jgi:hypothetical protein
VRQGLADGSGVQPGQFFRRRLLSITTYDELQELQGEYRKEQRELRRQIVSIMWHMRGGVTREEAWTLCYQERRDMMKFIDERIKLVEKTGLPLL